MCNNCAHRCHLQKRLPKSNGEPQTLHPVWDRVPALLRWDGRERAVRLWGVCWTLPRAGQGDLSQLNLFFAQNYYISFFWNKLTFVHQCCVDEAWLKLSISISVSKTNNHSARFRLCVKTLSTTTDWNPRPGLHKSVTSVHQNKNRFSTELILYSQKWKIIVALLIFIFIGHWL